MKSINSFLIALTVILWLSLEDSSAQSSVSSQALSFQSDPSWIKCPANPVLGDPVRLGTCFDVNVITDGKARFNMYFSWRPQKAIAITYSEDGIRWTDPQIVLDCDSTSGWEDVVNRSCTLFWNGKYHMWYTGQSHNCSYSKIGYAVSDDGIHFRRVQKDPVLVPMYNYEGYSVMNPYVIRDEKRGVFRMWYSSGETYEPNVICYAESKDGISWERSMINPIFTKSLPGQWDQDRIGGCEVHQLEDGTYALFYIGYTDINTARIGAAISPDGITQWKRLGTNPLIQPTEGSWDGLACYKPSAYYDKEKDQWMIWYNGRTDAGEFIGLATHKGKKL